MSRKLSKEKQAVWDRLNHVPLSRGGDTFVGNLDVNSMYPHMVDTIVSFNRKELEAKGCVNIRVVKSR